MRFAPPILFVAAFGLLAAGQKPIGEVSASDATVKGSVSLGQKGATVMSGSQVTAGSSTAQLKLSRGGTVNVCSGSTVSVSNSTSGEELMFAMSNGSLETNYKLGTHADIIQTPDFRIQLTGPGTFHIAVAIQPNNLTCVESLPGNASSAIITETFGDASYQLQTGKSVKFKNGKVEGLEEVTRADCGCPGAEAAPPPKQFDPSLRFPEEQSRAAAATSSDTDKNSQNKNVATPVDPAQPGKVYAHVDAPMVFNGNSAPAGQTQNAGNADGANNGQPAAPNAYPTVKPPEPVQQSSAPAQSSPAPAGGAVQPAASQAQPTQKDAKGDPQPAKKGWFRRFLSKIFK